jgi:hypothetical protein
MQDRSRYNADNLNNIICDASRHFRNKKRAYPKVKIEELEANSMIKLLGTCIGASVTLRRVTSLEQI